MIYCFNPEECKNEDMEIATFLAAFALYLKSYNPVHAFEELCWKGLVEYDGFDLLNQPLNLRLSPVGLERVEAILSRSKMANPKHENKRVENLAKQLMEIFPQGKKPGAGNNMYWRCNLRENIKSLERFFLKYGYNTYTDEEILAAAEKYVHPVNGDMTGVRLLKYFIIKNVKDIDDAGIGYIREVSDLATLLDNMHNDTEETYSNEELI